MRSLLTTLKNVFRTPPPEPLPINVLIAHYLYEAFIREKDVEKAKQCVRHKVSKLLCKEFSNIEFEVVAKSEDHVYYRLPVQMQTLFKHLEKCIDAQAQFLHEVVALKSQK